MGQYKSLVKKVSIPPEKKTKQKEYLKEGVLPIIDQGQHLIGGYSDKPEMQLNCTLPVIVFGDHTKAVKYIDFPFGAGADGIKVLQPNPGIVPKYLYYATQYLVLRLEDKGYARHYQHVEKKELEIPDWDEQQRIVARIEELFSQLDNAVATLNTIKQQLAVYRQAVLSSAFEKAGTNDIPLRKIIEKPRYGTSKKCSYEKSEHTIPVYRIPNIDFLQGRISHADLKYASFSSEEFSALKLCAGDILLIRSNGSVSLVGRSAIVSEGDILGLFAGYLMRLRIKEVIDIVPKYLNLYLSTHVARSQIEQKAKSTSGVNNINSDEISQITLPVCDLDIQRKIIVEIETRLSVCDDIEKTVDTALQQAEALRQSILKKAFEGRL